MLNMKLEPSTPQNATVEAQNRQLIYDLYEAIFQRLPSESALNHWLDKLKTSHSIYAMVHELAFCTEALMFRKSRLFVPPGHFYSPVVDVESVDAFLKNGVEKSPPPTSVPNISIDANSIKRNWLALVPFMKEAPFKDEKTVGQLYQLSNPSYGFGDGYMLNAMLRRYDPKRVIEVGCGWSSACIIDTVEKQLPKKPSLTFIEPHTKLLQEILGETAGRYRVLESRVQDVPLREFEELEANDILFIDSTHVLKTGSDVCFELFDVLPRLRKGVIVHFHDMFWPFEYPRGWVVKDNRSWNELYAMRAFLSHNKDWDVIMFNDYLGKVMPTVIKDSFPKFSSDCGGALWLQRR